MTDRPVESYSHIVIGGGVYGCYLATKLVEMLPDSRVLVVERERDILLRASYNNQARIHNGYHYPRSLLTGLRSRINFPRFVEEFRECVTDNFDQLYAIAAQRSNVTADQFYQFCERVGAPIHVAPPRFRKLFNPELIENVFVVTEYAFDANKLRELLRDRLARVGIRTLTNTEARKIILQSGSNCERGHVLLALREMDSTEMRYVETQYVYNCSYAKLNSILGRSGLAKLYLRHEATEIALTTVPKCLETLGITVMCGPFFSIMPFPARRLYSFSHVAYTPHYEWKDEPDDQGGSGHSPKFPFKSSYESMIRDAARYLPIVSDCSYIESIWEVKTILPRSDGNDSRPILFKADPSIRSVISVMGGKIDNIFDLDEPLRAHLRSQMEPIDVS